MRANLYVAATALLPLLSMLSGCSTTSVGLTYAPPAAVVKATPAAPIMVGTFVDQRGVTPSTWLGAIRGGFGNPLKTLEADRPVSALVQAAFVEGLRARGASVETAAPVQLSGAIRKLDSNQYARLEANVEIDITVSDSGGQQRFVRTYKTSNISGSILNLQAGIFGSVEDLRALTEKTLRETVDKALDDTALRAALRL